MTLQEEHPRLPIELLKDFRYICTGKKNRYDER